MASQIISALQQAGRHTKSISVVAKTSKRQRKKQKAELALALLAPVGPLGPLNSWMAIFNMAVRSITREVTNTPEDPAAECSMLTPSARRHCGALPSLFKMRAGPVVNDWDAFVNQSEPHTHAFVIYRLDFHEVIKAQTPGIHNNGNAALCAVTSRTKTLRLTHSSSSAHHSSASLDPTTNERSFTADDFAEQYRHERREWWCNASPEVKAEYKDSAEPRKPSEGKKRIALLVEVAAMTPRGIRRNKIRRCIGLKAKDYSESPPKDKNLLVLDRASTIETHLYGTCPHGAGSWTWRAAK
ncbi:hypothetical protein PRZ48_005732 [Zasmidium cellare]|uniref:Uncharacterized protein n=1 Tax=Zasmidium cellare TaxID=395010 RepID=A0ABR0EL64_ZASCE|nr:hypothetical protein PRZ48_005732 [Zasmidium cellare]